MKRNSYIKILSAILVMFGYSSDCYSMDRPNNITRNINELSDQAKKSLKEYLNEFKTKIDCYINKKEDFDEDGNLIIHHFNEPEGVKYLQEIINYCDQILRCIDNNNNIDVIDTKVIQLQNSLNAFLQEFHKLESEHKYDTDIKKYISIDNDIKKIKDLINKFSNYFFSAYNFHTNSIFKNSILKRK